MKRDKYMFRSDEKSLRLQLVNENLIDPSDHIAEDVEAEYRGEFDV